jgi:hypothetical protein
LSFRNPLRDAGARLSPIHVFLARDSSLSTTLSRRTDNKGWAKLVSTVANNYQPAQQMIPTFAKGVCPLREVELLTKPVPGGR